MPPRKPANRARSIRLTDAEWEHLAERGRLWCPMQPVTPTTVMRLLIQQDMDAMPKTKPTNARNGRKSDG